MKHYKIIEAKNQQFNRKTLEKEKNIVLMSPEKQAKYDSLKTLDSGLNEVLGRIASKNNNSIGISMGYIRHMPQKQKATQLARIRQNIMICRKTKTHLYLAENEQNTKLILIALGASTQQIKETTSQSF